MCVCVCVWVTGGVWVCVWVTGGGWVCVCGCVSEREEREGDGERKRVEGRRERGGYRKR